MAAALPEETLLLLLLLRLIHCSFFRFRGQPDSASAWYRDPVLRAGLRWADDGCVVRQPEERPPEVVAGHELVDDSVWTPDGLVGHSAPSRGPLQHPAGRVGQLGGELPHPLGDAPVLPQSADEILPTVLAGDAVAGARILAHAATAGRAAGRVRFHGTSLQAPGGRGQGVGEQRAGGRCP